MTATYLSKDQYWDEGITIYWFDVGGETYGIQHDGPCCPLVVDKGGKPVPEPVASKILKVCTVLDEHKFD